MFNFILGILQLCSIIKVSVYEYKKKSLSVFLWATLLLMFGIPHFLSITTGTSTYSDDIMIKSSIYVIFFNLFYLITKGFIYSFKIKVNRFSWDVNINPELSKLRPISHSRTIRLKKILFASLVSCFVILILFTIKYMGSLSNASWGNFRNTGAKLGFKNIIRYTTLILIAVSGITLVYLKEKKRIMVFTSMIIIVLYTFITGNRIIILPVLISVILYYFYIFEKKINIKTIIMIAVLGFSSIYIVYFLRLTRIYGGFYNMFNNNGFVELSKRNLEMILNGDGELSLRNAFYHFIYHNNNFLNFNKGHTYIRLLLMPIPTRLIPGIKPFDFAITMGSAWLMKQDNYSYSMHPTLYGDSFANFWWFGILLGVFWAIFSFSIDEFVNKKSETIRMVLMVLFSMSFVVAGRGSVYNGFFYSFIGIVILLSIHIFSKIKFRK